MLRLALARRVLNLCSSKLFALPSRQFRFEATQTTIDPNTNVKPRKPRSKKAVEPEVVIEPPKELTLDELKTQAMSISNPPGVTMVTTLHEARRVVQILRSLPDEVVHACDTETTDIDLSCESPIGHGRVICFSIYCGPQYDFGSGPSVFVDLMLGESGILDVFKPYFEDVRVKKAWHNYSFDRAVLGNHDVNTQGFAGDTMHMARLWSAARIRGYSLEALSKDLLPIHKSSMTERFGKPRILKNGTVGKLIEVPNTIDLHTKVEYRSEWITYSTHDTELTWHLHQKLQQNLRNMPWSDGRTMYDFFVTYWVPFGELLTDMEKMGFYVETPHLKAMEHKAIADRDEAQAQFMQWVSKHTNPDVAKLMNVGSDAQIQQLFFAPYCRPSDGVEILPAVREFVAENSEAFVEEGKTKAKKKRTFEVKGLGMPPISLTDSGKPSADGDALRKLAGNIQKKQYGTAYAFFGGGDAGHEACVAIDALNKMHAIDTLLSGFIQPLQTQANQDSNSRIHCSLNLNTETGRLSARRPNLQNQPALEKDQYKIRQAFTAAPGKRLIVADYGQLELRILAHMARCQSMIDAFAAGGDFHSRTAMGMYTHVSDAVKAGTVLLEAGDAKHDKSIPLLKDQFASERRKAKTLNFSIAYGKTAHGLSRDWNVTLAEAQDTVERWYADRPEVRQWQQYTIENARQKGYTRTLMGRYRELPGISPSQPRMVRAHAERAAINTPIQGGAADVVMKAMLVLQQNQRFAQLGWRIVLQVHDEIICEGPEESTAEALSIVKQCMMFPFKQPLLVDLIVDAKAARTWFEAK